MQSAHIPKAIVIGALWTIGSFLLLGIITVLVPNTFFSRMTPIDTLDYVFLSLTSLLIGIYVGLGHLSSATDKSCKISSSAGGIGGFLGFACPPCNKIIVLAIGYSGAMTYIEPYRPILGSIGILLLSYAVFRKYKLVIPNRKVATMEQRGAK